MKRPILQKKAPYSLKGDNGYKKRKQKQADQNSQWVLEVYVGVFLRDRKKTRGRETERLMKRYMVE